MADSVSFRDRPLTLDLASEHGSRVAERVSPVAAHTERSYAGELFERLETALRSADAGATSVRPIWLALVGEESDES